MGEPYWMTIARAELRRGVYEIPGPASLARIEEYQATCTSWIHSDDAIPWCSSFVNWCIECGDIDSRDFWCDSTPVFCTGTKSARARSWLAWGSPISLPPIGAVMILKRGSGVQPGPTVLDAKGHVTFYDGWADPLHVIGLGGNQSNMVRASFYKSSDILGFRWAA